MIHRREFLAAGAAAVVPDVPRSAHLRVARASDDLDGVTAFYRDGLGFEVLYSFKDHEGFDGVMLGRAAYHDSYVLAETDARLFGGTAPTREAVVRHMHRYAAAQAAHGTPLRAIARHLLGLYQGRPGARLWRRMLSDAQALAANDHGLLLDALERVEGQVEVVAA